MWSLGKCKTRFGRSEAGFLYLTRNISAANFVASLMIGVSAVAKKRQPNKPRKKPAPATPPDVKARQVAAVLDLIAHAKHGTLKACEAVGVSPMVFYFWMRNDADIRERYELARELYFEALREECLDIADDSSEDFALTKQGPILRGEHVQRSALRVNTRKWLAEVGRPASTGYGAKDDEDDNAQFAKAVAILAELAAQKVAA